MCRRDQCHGIALLAFGLGILACCWIDTHFWRICLGVILSGAGLLILVKK